MKLAFLYDKKYMKPVIKHFFKDSTLSPKPVTGCTVLLRWGNIDGNDDNIPLVLNRKQCLKNCLDQRKVYEILSTNKIKRPKIVIPKPETRYPLIAKSNNLSSTNEVIFNFDQTRSIPADFFVERIDTLKKFNIYIFNMQVFLIAKKVPVKSNSSSAVKKTAWNYEEIPPDTDNDAQKISLLALRAVHVLGLDFAMVHGAIDVKNRPVVLEVNPAPPLNPRTAYLFHEKVIDFITNDAEHRTSKNEFRVLLGADPEFLLRDSRTGHIVYPSAYLKKDGEIGYDERSENREGRLYPLAEVRPEPDFCPLKLTEKIRALLTQAYYIFPEHVEWLAGSLQFARYQIGGHIHFSNLTINSALMRALDNYLGIPIMLIEDPQTSSKRRKQYGWLGSIRFKPHGGFEYRTPGSWLISPDLTRSCLCLAKIVATDYRLLNRDYLADHELQKAFYQSQKQCFYDIFNELWEDLCKTPSYEKYGCYLEPLKAIISNKMHWDENTDIRKFWGLLSD